MIERTRIVDHVPHLLGARCEACGHTTFPRRERCPACRTGTMEEAALGPDATIESTVALHVSTDESEAPYTLGMVRMADGPTVLARIDSVDAGEPARLVVDPERDVFWFARAEESNASPQGAESPNDKEDR